MNDAGRAGRTKGTPLLPSPWDQVQSQAGGCHLERQHLAAGEVKAAGPGTSARSSERGTWVHAQGGQQGEHAGSQN